MTHLLGRQDCVESLRRDLTDLQGEVLNVFSRTGPIRFPSWKFPDKMSCNLDLASLLERYDFIDGEEEFNQHAHVVLLELVIDRLVLLLQSFNAHAELMLSGQRSGSQSRPTCPSGSIGLVVKRYWNNLAQLCSLCQRSQGGTTKEVPVKKDVEQLRPSCEKKAESLLASSLPGPRSNPSRRSSFCASHQSSLCPDSGSSTCLPGVSVDTRTVGCQTVESCLVPCNACARVQSSLREVSNALVQMCQSQGLPSSLGGFLAAVDDFLEPGQLSAADVGQWAVEQRRDLGRVEKHLSEVRATVQPLRESSAALEKERNELREQLKRMLTSLTQERAKQRASLEELELRLQEVRSQGEEAVNRLLQEQEELRRGAVSLEEENSKLKAELTLQLDNLHMLEGERSQLQQEVKAWQLEQSAVLELEDRSRTLEANLASSQLLLDKECAKYQSACRQQESLQAKQRALIERLDSLDQECEELQGRLAESEEGRTELQDRLAHISEETSQWQTQLTQQQALCNELCEEKQIRERRVEELQASVAQLQDEVLVLTKRERLLVAFPELSPVTVGPPQSTGDLLGDMERQLEANSVRIRVLEQENSTLSSSLSKLRERAQEGDFKLPAHSLSQVPGDNGGNPPSSKESSSYWQERQPRVRVAARASKTSETVGSWDNEALTPSSLSASSSSTVLHRQTLGLPLTLQADAAKTYDRIRRTSRARSAGMHPKRK